MGNHFSYEELRAREYLVRRRLKLVDKLSSLKEHFLDEDEMILVSENEWTHPVQDYQGLRNYLLLTCFDILGQTKEWKPYGDWLEQKSNPERDLLIAQNVNEDHLTVSKKLYAVYNKLYGTKNSFYRFINEIISPERRAELLKSIIIKKIDKSTNTYILYEPTEQVKLKFLFKIRNSHTHEGLTMGSPGIAIMRRGQDIEEDGIFDEGRQKFGEILIHYEIKRDTLIHYRVRRWPTLLKEIIEEALPQ